MPKAPDASIVSDTIDEDLTKLEAGIRNLKIQYDRFLAGGLKREPILARGEVVKLIKRYGEVPLKKYAHRFRYNALVNKFNIFSELWGKSVRRLEEGDGAVPSRRAKPAARPARPPAGAPRAEVREQLVATCRISKSGDQKALRELYGQFSDAREAAGRGKLSYPKFLKGINAQTDRLQKDGKCAEIELSLVVLGDRIQLKARAGR